MWILKIKNKYFVKLTWIKENIYINSEDFIKKKKINENIGEYLQSLILKHER